MVFEKISLSSNSSLNMLSY